MAPLKIRLLGSPEVIFDGQPLSFSTQKALALLIYLLAAAVLGRTCTFERMCQVADLSETEALEVLEALLDGRLLTERPSDRRPYTLAHDYIREVVYSESREARRRVFHRRALLALEAAGGSAAERLRDEAREVVGYIVEHAGELRETFLAQPEVGALLN